MDRGYQDDVSILDTGKMDWLAKIQKKEIKLSRRLVTSLEGLLTYLAAVIQYLKAPLGWLQRRVNAQRHGLEQWSEKFEQRFFAYWNYVMALLSKWNGSLSLLSGCWVDQVPDLNVVSDASCAVGFGAFCLERKEYGYGVWSDEEKAEAFRFESSSSTHLEVVAMCMAVLSFVPPHSSVRVLSDSTAAVAIMLKHYCKSSDDPKFANFVRLFMFK